MYPVLGADWKRVCQWGHGTIHRSAVAAVAAAPHGPLTSAESMIRLALLAALACDTGDAPPKSDAERPVGTEASGPPHTAACTGDAPGPDVVIVSIDTLRADRLGFAGHPNARTPRLDALAEAGTVFRQATTPVPRTTPALASMMTGLSPHHHGSREVGDVIVAPQRLPTLLAEHGWRTVGISAMPVAGPKQKMDKGYDVFEVHYDAPAVTLAQHTLDRVKEVPTDCPLMVWTHFADPHFPYLPPKTWADQPDAPGCRALSERATNGKVARYKYFGNRDGIAEPLLADCSALYDAEIAYADHGVGTLLDGLAALGRTDPIVVFTADHGENMGEWGLYFEHGPNGHDASLRIPLVFKGPGVRVATVDDPATLEDVMPTLLALTGVTAPDAMPFDGRDLFGTAEPPPWVRAESGSTLHARLTDYLVAGRAKRLHCIHGPRYSLCDGPKRSDLLFDRTTDPDLKRPLLAGADTSVLAITRSELRSAWAPWPVERTRQRLVRTPSHTLVATPTLSGRYDVALYNHQADPELTTNVAATEPEVAATLTPILTAWHAELDAANTPVSERTEEQEEALRALGYIE